MCGIIGFFDTKGKKSVDIAPVRTGMEAMVMRGPDDKGLFSAPGIALGHRRLSIIDVAGGSQPLVHNQTGCVLVYNGEIYNFRELRARLEEYGHVFSTRSDTEVLMNAYIQWEENCLDHISGMFAFAMYDPRKDQLFLARDRIGIKPLYYCNTGSELMFASTCKAMLAFPEVSRKLSMDAVSHYLSTIRNVLGNQTLYQDIKTLLPGEQLSMKLGDSHPRIKKYWEIPIIPESDKCAPDIKQAVLHARELLSQSVSEQLISDVPLGGFLSGGVDSSIIASLANPMTSGNYNAYSIGYERDGYNEWPFVRESAHYNDMSCREIHLDEDSYSDTWKMLIESKGLPLSTPNEVPIYHLAHELRNDFTVALSGEGADEIFGGYVTPYFSAIDYDRARRSSLKDGDVLSEIDMAIARAYRRPYLICRPDHYFLVNSWVPFPQKRALLTGEAWSQLENDNRLFGYYEDLFKKVDKCSTFDAYMHVHARVNLEGLLSRVDSSTMAASVEARVPFTDHRIVEYLFSLPDSYKMHWKDSDAEKHGAELNINEIDSKSLVETKILLRRAFIDNVPESVMKRKKVSFPVPFREWFANGMKDAVTSAIEDSDLLGNVIKPDYVKSILSTSDQYQSAMALWPIVNLCMWQKECGVEI